MNAKILLLCLPLVGASLHAQTVTATGDIAPAPGGSPANWTIPGQTLLVGNTGTGVLQILNGGVVSGSAYGALGVANGSIGTVDITGIGSLWSNSVNIVVGSAGTGFLNLSAGGNAVDQGGIIAGAAGGTGTVVVTGTGSYWQNLGALTIGSAGDGTLTVSDGGKVTNESGVIGSAENSIGTVTVTGAASLWQTASLVIGNSGAGTLTLADGGTVEVDGGAGAVTLAANASSTGTLNFGAYDLSAATTAGRLDTAGIAFGAGTGVINFNQTDALTFNTALSGTGALVQRGTGTTTLADDIALDAGSAVTVKQGTLVVDAALTLAAGTITVGDTSGDNGSLIVRTGAQVSAANGYIGYGSGATGIATVTGAGALWDNAASLSVGNRGAGTLTLADGGTVRIADGAGTLVMGGFDQYDSSGVGTLNFGSYDLSAPTTTGTLDAAVIVAHAGDSYINFNQTDTLVFSQTVSGFDSGGHTTITQRGTGTTIVTGDVRTIYTYVNQGTLIVDGAGASIHDSPLGVRVGQSSGDNGYLTVRNGGNLSFIGGLGSTAYGYLGYNAGATGTVLVTGAGSTLRGGYLALGLYGHGALTLADGGALILREAGLLSIGTHEGSVGTLNIGSYDLANPTTAGVLDVGSISFGDGVGDIYFNQTDDFTVAANITRTPDADAQDYPVTVTQRGTGTTTLAGTNTYRGATNVRGGTLKIIGSIAHSDFNFTIGLESGENAQAVIDADAAATDQHGVIGWQAGSTGAVTVNDGAIWTNLGDLRVGERGAGSLTINTGTVTAGGVSSIGVFSGATGTVTLNGGALTATGEVRVGDSGIGTLTLNDGIITGTLANIARGNGSTGTVTMNGGTWNNTGGLFVVGNAGVGTFTQTGGTVNTVTGQLARSAGGTGVATVSGGLWNNTGDLAIGEAGIGTLTLIGDGVVAADGTVYIANAAGSTGTLNFGAHDLAHATTTGTLDAARIAFGSGTGVINFNQTDTLMLAADISGHGKLVQRGVGTTVLIGNTTLGTGGEYDGVTTIKQGTLAMAGADARLTQTAGALFVGDLAGDNGAFIVRNGAQVADTRGYVGLRTGSIGAATVTGANSLWSHSSDLAIGYSGSGALTISDGGQVTNLDSYIGYASGASGVATVTGAGSLWQTADDFFVGHSGTGEVTVSAGGTLTSAYAALAYDIGSSGTATITGAGSAWTNGLNLDVGRYGTGTLNISGGATVSNQGAYLGTWGSASRGTATVDGVGSLWTSQSHLRLGNEGTGTLTVSNGGTVTTLGALQIANAAGSNGTLNIGAHDLAHATTGGTLTTANGIAFGAGVGVINFNQTDAFTLAAAISGHGTVNQRGTGTTTLTAANTYTGDTNILDGTLALAGDGSLAGSSTIHVASGATFDVSVLTGGFTLGATQALVGGGTILGDVTVAGALAPGDSATTADLLTFDGNLTLDATATLSFELGGTERGLDFDAIDVTGDLAYDGSLVLSLRDGFTLRAGDSFQLFSVAGTTTGAFAQVSFENGLWAGAFDYDTGVLTIAAVPEPATSAAFAAVAILAFALLRQRRRNLL